MSDNEISEPFDFDQPPAAERQTSYIIVRKQSRTDQSDIARANQLEDSLETDSELTYKHPRMDDSGDNGNNDAVQMIAHEQEDDLVVSSEEDDDQLSDMTQALKDSQLTQMYASSNDNHARTESGLLTPIDENFNNKSGHIIEDNGVKPLSPDLNDLASVLEQLRLSKQDLEDERERSKTLQKKINLLKTSQNKELQQIRQKSKISLDLTNNIIERQIADEHNAHQTKYEQDIARVTKDYETKIREIEGQYKQRLNQSEKLRRQSVHEMDLQIKELTTQHKMEKTQMESQIRTLQQNIEAETSKDRLIREWHTKYDDLMKEFKSMKESYEGVIEGMTNEHQAELEEENNRFMDQIGHLKRDNRTLKKQTNETKADNKNLNTLIGQLKDKLKKYVNETNTLRAHVKQRDLEIKQLKTKLAKASGNNTNEEDGKETSPNPTKKHQRVHSINRRNSSITILDDGTQKTIEIINLGNEVQDEDLVNLLGSDPMKATAKLGTGLGPGNFATPVIHETEEENLLKINNEEKQIMYDESGSASPSKDTASQIESLNLKIRQLTSTVNRLTNEKERLETKIEAANSKHSHAISSLEEEMSEKEHTLKTRFEFQIEHWKQETERLKEKMINTEEDLKAEIIMKNQRIDELDRLLTDKTDENNNMSEMMRYLEDRIALLQDYEADIEAYEDEINAIDQENQKLMEEKEQVLETLNKQKDEVTKLEDTYHKTKDTLAEMTNIVETLKQENQQLKSGVSNRNLDPYGDAISDDDFVIEEDVEHTPQPLKPLEPIDDKKKNMYEKNEKQTEQYIEQKIEERLQKRLSVAILENEKTLSTKMETVLAREKEKWERESERAQKVKMENERRVIRDELEDIYQPRMNELNEQIRNLKQDLNTLREKHQQEVKEICESKLQLVRALGAAMDSMREELRPKKGVQ